MTNEDRRGRDMTELQRRHQTRATSNALPQTSLSSWKSLIDRSVVPTAGALVSHDTAIYKYLT